MTKEPRIPKGCEAFFFLIRQHAVEVKITITIRFVTVHYHRYQPLSAVLPCSFMMQKVKKKAGYLFG